MKPQCVALTVDAGTVLVKDACRAATGDAGTVEVELWTPALEGGGPRRVYLGPRAGALELACALVWALEGPGHG